MNEKLLKKALARLPDETLLIHGGVEGLDPDDPDGLRDPDRAVALFRFTEKDTGCGEIALIMHKGRMFVNTEHMDKDSVKRILLRAIDAAITEYDEDPKNHLLANDAFRRVCGDHCKICYPESP